MKIKQAKPRKTRNWIAVAAWDRNSSGPITSKRKEQSKQECRRFNGGRDEV
jgi:hypothetical protein